MNPEPESNPRVGMNLIDPGVKPIPEQMMFLIAISRTAQTSKLLRCAQDSLCAYALQWIYMYWTDTSSK